MVLSFWPMAKNRAAVPLHWAQLAATRHAGRVDRTCHALRPVTPGRPCVPAFQRHAFDPNGWQPHANGQVMTRRVEPRLDAAMPRQIARACSQSAPDWTRLQDRT
jgi:hypothetical protein